MNFGKSLRAKAVDNEVHDACVDFSVAVTLRQTVQGFQMLFSH